MELKAGYKQTEVGIIPEDWEVKKIGYIAPLQRGFDLPSTQLKQGIYPVIYSNGILNYHREYKAKGQGVITGRSGTIGKVTFIDDYYYPHNTTLWVTDFKGNEPKFIYYLYSYIGFERFSTGSGVPTLNRNDVHIFQVPLPTKTEQTAIATALSDMDALINALDKLIAKKRLIKQGAMQELLSGKKRLAGVSGEWEVKKFEDVMTGFSSGATPYRGKPEYYKGDIRWITSGELNYNVITDTIEKITEDAVINTNLKILPIGAFLIAITGLEAAGTRGSCGIVGAKATTNQSCMALFPMENLDSDYLYHYYVYKGDEFAFKYCQGTKQQSYTGKLVRTLPINIPPTKKEQTAIAQILSDMDSDILALETQRDKTLAIKQGMMQELLTGKTRLMG